MFTIDPTTKIVKTNPVTGEQTVFGTGYYDDGDTLPTEGIENGTAALNMDTGTVKFFSQSTQTWKEF